jgi:glycosyltransferase involved in cell wall biosynthesis
MSSSTFSDRKIPRIEIWLERLREANSKLPFVAEWALAWIVIFFFSILYFIDYIKLNVRMFLLKRSPQKWCRHIPLTTLPHTKSNRTASSSPSSTPNRLESLQRLLEKGASCATDDTTTKSLTDERVIELVRSNQMARHLASLVMVNEDGPHNKNILESSKLAQQLQRIWPQLLEFPAMSMSSMQNKTYPFEISLIIPVFHEKNVDVLANLTYVLHHCTRPKEVQVVLVDAGGSSDDSNPDLHDSIRKDQLQELWGQVQVVQYTSGGGRGSCLNFGAAHAVGKILTFLHSDTLLPPQWNKLVEEALTTPTTSGPNTEKDVIVPHACTFSMGIDHSPRGLKGERCPPGIRGCDRVLAYLRINLCSLPYGDSALSFPASYFHHLGGYPDQPLMEDYEIMSLLRQRAHVLKERLVILPAVAECSPRRWQAYGVPYTALSNALIIHRYKHGMTADELFEFYYRRPLTNKKND